MNDHALRYPLCIIDTVIATGGFYISEDRFRSMFGVKIYCEKNQRRKVEELFRDTFDPLWLKAREYVESNYGNCPQEENDEWPYHFSGEEEYGVFIAISTFVLEFCGGEYYCTDDLGWDAFYKTLNVLVKTFPNIRYEGYICEFISDRRSGDYEESYLQYRIADDEVQYDFIGEYLNEALKTHVFLIYLKEYMDMYLEEYEAYVELLDFFWLFRGNGG